MKNKKSTIGLMLLMAGSLVLTNCTKNKTNEAPTPDTDMSSTIEIVNTQMILSDIHEICGQVCEANSYLLPYQDGGASISIKSGTNTIVGNPAINFADNGNKYYSVTFNNTVGRDGHIRNGILTFNYSLTTVASTDYYRQAQWKCNVSSTGYSIDDYTVQINSMSINNVNANGFPTVNPHIPANDSLTWEQTANLSILRAVGGNTNTTTFNGKFVKRLYNTNNTAVPMPSGAVQTTFTVFPTPYGSALYLHKQHMGITGYGEGVLSDGSPYSFQIQKPLQRVTVSTNSLSMPATTSSPEPFIALGGLLTSPERHPFLTGVMTFKAGTKGERTVDFGPSAEVVDYNAKVTIDGISYSLDIK